MTSPRLVCWTGPSAGSPRSGATWRRAWRTSRSPRRCAPVWRVAAARSARAIARPSWRETYQGLDEAGRKDFLRTLASFNSDADAVAGAYAEVQAAADPAELATAKAALRRALEPPRLRLLTQFTTHPGWPEVPGRPARLPAEGAARRQAAGGAGCGPARPARRVVRHRLPRTAADRLEQPGGAAGEAGGLRGGARDPLLARSQEPAGFRPPLLCVLSSAHAGRAADLRRGGAGEGAGGQRAEAAGREGAGAGSARGGYRDLLFDQQLPAGPGGHQLRQFPDQARGGGTVGRIPQSEDVRHAVADPRVSRLAGREACRGPAGAAVGR